MNYLNMVTMSFELVFLVSIVAGLIGAMSGMGGGIVLIPALTLLGLDIKHAIAISIVSVVATSSGAASAYVRDRIINLKLGMFLEMFTIIGALAGATITVIVSAQGPLFIVFGLVLLASLVTLFLRRQEDWKPVAHQDAFSGWLELEGSYDDQATGQTVYYRGARAYFGGPLMFGAGLIAGLLGIGAGALKVLIIDLAMGLPPKVSTTTSNLIIGITALAGTSIYLAAGLIDPGLAAPVILGVVAGAFIGTRLLVRLTNQKVRRFFMVVLAVLGIEMILRGVGVIP
ncbi:MAG: sulfite exporter TauE/SafE family protein [Thermoleophilia bacterium]